MTGKGLQNLLDEYHLPFCHQGLDEHNVHIFFDRGIWLILLEHDHPWLVHLVTL